MFSGAENGCIGDRWVNIADTTVLRRRTKISQKLCNIFLTIIFGNKANKTKDFKSCSENLPDYIKYRMIS